MRNDDISYIHLVVCHCDHIRSLSPWHDFLHISDADHDLDAPRDHWLYFPQRIGYQGYQGYHSKNPIPWHGEPRRSCWSISRRVRGDGLRVPMRLITILGEPSIHQPWLRAPRGGFWPIMSYNHMPSFPSSICWIPRTVRLSIIGCPSCTVESWNSDPRFVSICSIEHFRNM